MEQTRNFALPFPLTVFLCGWVLAFPVSIPAIFIGFSTQAVNYSILCGLMLLSGALGGFLAVRSRRLPDSFRRRCLIAAAPLLLCLLLCLPGLLLGKGNPNSIALLPYALSQISFFPIMLYTALTGGVLFMLFFPLTFHLAFLGSFLCFERRRADAPPLDRRTLYGLLGSVAALLAAIAAVYFYGQRNVLPRSYSMEYGGGYSSVDLWSYDLISPENRLPRLTEPSTFTVTGHDRMPVLDGAEAAYPVYSAFALACYEDITTLESDIRNQKDIQYDQAGGKAVTFTNTIYAYERLLSGDVDIFFGAQPSAAQRQLAEEAGKELVLTPIALEAFVFFVSAENPVEALSSEEIRAVYSGKTKNWSALGGPDTRILAFQRPENSGSQTIMQKFMGNLPLREPLEVEYSPGMGGTVRKVAEYQNTPDALGYSFRFFLTGMADSSGVKMLTLDGVPPSSENIASRAYPYTVELYAVTLADNQNEYIAPFLQWMQSAQGQELVERIGYVALPKS